jgi:hypothetical protein
MDPVKILRRAWYILWSYRALWVFGLILALAVGSSVGRGSNNNYHYDQNHEQNSKVTPQSMQEAFHQFQSEIHKLFEQGIPEIHVTGKDLTTFLWVIGAFVLVMLIVGIIMAVARYVSETAVIRMVDEYEGTGNKLTVRQGFRMGWSNTSWRLFLINLIVNLPAIAGLLIVITAAAAFAIAAANGNAKFTPVSLLFTVGSVILIIFLTVIVTILLHLLRNFFWRICVLEDASVTESLRRGFAMVRENWKNVGLMWLVMIGLGIVWAVASIILIIFSIPVVIVTCVIALLVVALPYLVFVGFFTTFLGGYLPWIAGALFVAPFFFPIAFSPWVLLGSWQSVYTSTVWTLTYREIKALPVLATPPQVEPVGD